MSIQRRLYRVKSQCEIFENSSIICSSFPYLLVGQQFEGYTHGDRVYILMYFSDSVKIRGSVLSSNVKVVNQHTINKNGKSAVW